MSSLKQTAAGIAALAALAAPRAAGAQGNDRSAPTGGRSALMGNTGVALGRDGAAPFMNPATIGAIDDQRLAFSVNFFTYSLTHFSHWNQPGPVNTAQYGPLSLDGAGDSATRFHGLPSTLCLFFTLGGLGQSEEESKAARNEPRGRQKLAICLGSLESEDVSLSALSFRGSTPAGSTGQVESIAHSWNRLYAGPTYSVALTDRLAVGASLHGVVTSDSLSIESSSITSIVGTTPGAMQSALGASAYGYSFDLTANLGATYQVGRVTVGADAQLPALHVLGRFQATTHDEDGGAGATANVSDGSGSFLARPPMRIAAGVGVEWPRLTLEFDESFDFEQTSDISSSMNLTSTDLVGGVAKTTSSQVTYTLPSRPMLNSALGAEYFVTRGFSVIGGVSTNISTLSGLSPNPSVGNLIASRANHVGLAFGIGSYGGAGDILLGTQLDYGWGQALVVNPYTLPNTWSALDTQTYTVLFVLAGTTSLRAITRAVEKVERAVTTGSPDAEPATRPAGSSPPQDPEPAPPK